MSELGVNLLEKSAEPSGFLDQLSSGTISERGEPTAMPQTISDASVCFTLDVFDFPGVLLASAAHLVALLEGVLGVVDHLWASGLLLFGGSLDLDDAFLSMTLAPHNPGDITGSERFDHFKCS